MKDLIELMLNAIRDPSIDWDNFSGKLEIALALLDKLPSYQHHYVMEALTGKEDVEDA